MTLQKLTGTLSAAGAAMALLFTGNWLVGQAVPAQPQDQIAVVETLPPETLPEASLPEPTGPAQTEPLPDPRKEALTQAAQGMEADSIFVYDTTTGEMLFCSTGPEDTLYPASITKLFTAWVALRYLEPETVITAGNELAMVQPGSSTAYIKKGCRLTVEMLIEAMLLPSGNDAAYVLAAAAGRAAAGDDSLSGEAAVAVFVEAMNREARQIGLTGSCFENPDGYHHETHISCPVDLVKMGLLALREPVIARYAGLQQDSVVFESGQWINWYNTNSLLNPESKYYVPGCLGLKTGYTSEAGYCLLAAFRQGEGYLLVGIFGAETKFSRYTDAMALLQLCQ